METRARRRVRSYRDLDCWKESLDLVATCYGIARTLPRIEERALAQQLRRAAVSIPSNIAEGNGSRARRNYIRYLGIAHASLMEVETHLHVAHRLGYLSDAVFERTMEQCGTVGRLLGGLIRKLRQME